MKKTLCHWMKDIDKCDHSWIFKCINLRDKVRIYECFKCRILYQTPIDQPLIITHQNYDEMVS